MFQTLSRIVRSVLSIISRRERQASGEQIDAVKPTAAPISAGPPASLPLGARFRTRSEGYSMSLAQMEQVSVALQQIPPLPRGAMQVMRELDSTEASAASVAQAIGREP